MRYEITNDDDPENPCEWTEWEPISFGNRHTNYKDPADVGIKGVDRYGDVVASQRLQRKLDSNTAFVLSYYEHSSCVWFLKGHGAPGTDCRWDGRKVAGLLRWNGKARDIGKTLEDREKNAKLFIESYTQWCNGKIYQYTIYDDDDEIVGSCTGMHGYEYAEQIAKEEMEALKGTLTKSGVLT
tara:strand:+ start:615 stop:1163 length:549 start_codon:yes stop_codon:yes gene_type:complete